MTSLIPAIVIGQTALATAHQPVSLTAKHSSPNKGPIMVDGTISFALRANFKKPKQQQGFRAAFKAGELLNFEYLIIDKAPENKMALSKLPVVTITAPDGTKSTVKFTERTKFYEPYGRTNYLFLSRFSSTAIEGIYSFAIRSKAKSAITVSTGSKEIFGEVYEPAICPTITPSNPVAITNAQAATLIGMKKKVAISCIQSLSGSHRIAQEDGQSFALTKDYRIDRVDLTLRKGFVTKVSVG
ncbi:MAG: hypothetical protein ABR73_04020 [Actinobacteria bacterium BACL4 MAG-121001-bin59]|nr:MAG: hypothetical protein ABR73_04020 [Actinobacteria bacterium BACL4 MAG-121001-bin59]KRO76105.1 MAG: hypothetical protein ABS07_01695 [Actinobacteria bacterium BACL4 MAG-120920-bin74]